MSAFSRPLRWFHIYLHHVGIGSRCPLYRFAIVLLQLCINSIFSWVAIAALVGKNWKAAERSATVGLGFSRPQFVKRSSRGLRYIYVY
jgi:hypothetical protein